MLIVAIGVDDDGAGGHGGRFGRVAHRGRQPHDHGANVGTSVTGSIASLGHVDKKEEFRRAFAATTVNDFFNLLAVLIFLPIEILFSPLRHAAEFLADLLYGTVLPDPGEADLLGALTDPVVDGRPAVAIGAGFAATMATQSSSVTTSVMVPFAGVGTLTTKQIYPLALGANVGTTFTALIAALAVTGDGGRLALVMALVHLCFNLAGILVIYVIPVLRNIPVVESEFIARLGAANKFWAIGWIAGVFFALPALVILFFVAVM